VVDTLETCYSSYVLSHPILSLYVKPFWYKWGSRKFGDGVTPATWNLGMTDSLETHFSIPCVTAPNLVILGH